MVKFPEILLGLSSLIYIGRAENPEILVVLSSLINCRVELPEILVGLSSP